jgi:EmrB/QacA subfamily drug resistance transporter
MAELSPWARRATLVAMTLANSMILVDQTAVPLAIPHVISALNGSLSTSQWVLTANVLPLAAFMVFAGRLGDQLGLRRIFLAGALLFIGSSAMAGAAQDMPWLITVRATQGVGAALMLPTTLAIVSAVFPERARGRALGVVAGASAFFAALGPVLGGLLTQYIDWRAVFLINVPLAAITVLLTLLYTPALRAEPGASRALDVPGLVTFAVGIGGLTLGLGQSQQWGWGSAATLVSLGLGVAGLVAFVVIEPRRRDPLMRFGFFRHLNFTAAIVSQLLAGSIELATAYLLPFYLLLIVGLAPGPAGLALIPATVPIIVVGPLAGRWFDRVGGRLPLTVGFLVLAASSFALVAGFPAQSLMPLIPGFVLQGIGLGIVLTVNDPTALGSVPAEDQGQASGINDTGEQLGGAVGIALFTVVLLHIYYGRLYGLLAERGITITRGEIEQGREFVLRAEQKGLHQVSLPPRIRDVLGQFEAAHVYAFQLTFVLMGVVAIVGAAVCWLLVRRGDHQVPTGIFSRRSRWPWTSTGEGPGLTRKPAPKRSNRGGPGDASQPRSDSDG